MIKVLDCTLRDGGYVNNWEFGLKNSQCIVGLLNDANIDFIEIGFLSNEKTDLNRTVFNSFIDVEKFVPFGNDKLVLMIAFDKFPLGNIPNANDTSVKNLRVIFKKHQIKNALDYCKQIVKKGFNLFINLTFITQYDDIELVEIIKQINQIKPFALSIVDSMGAFKKLECNKIFNLVDKLLDKDISLCFHSHNNLQLSFSNVKALIENNFNRQLIIDTTVYGIGRGAGNLATELLIEYLNEKNNSNYKLDFILKIIDEQIKAIYKKNPWGYSIPYFLSAINHCHPNYAKYIIENKNLSCQKINDIFQKIPSENKIIYDESVLKNILN